MLNRAFFSLQSNWIPTLVALGNLFVNLVLDLAFVAARRLGHPARDVAREHRRHRDAARPAPPPRRPDPLRRDRRVVVCGSCSPRSLAGGAAFGVWYGLDDAFGRGAARPDRLARRRADRRRGRLRRRVPRAPRPRAGHAPLAAARASAGPECNDRRNAGSSDGSERGKPTPPPWVGTGLPSALGERRYTRKYARVCNENCAKLCNFR